MQARFVVSIITKASFAREWIQFEAGAAWGRNIPYAPLLVDFPPADLPTTYGAYYATPIDNQEKLELLIDEIGKACGLKPKQQFKSRFRKLDRDLRRYRRSHGETTPTTFDDPDLDKPLEDALVLLEEGKTAEANRAFADIASKAVDPAAASEIMARRFWGGQESTRAERLALLDIWPDNARQADDYYFYRSVLESDPVEALAAAREFELRVSKRDNKDISSARIQVLSLLKQLGRQDEFDELVRISFCGADRKMRASIASRFSSYYPSAKAAEKLLVLGFGLWADSASGLAADLLELCLEEGWLALSVHFHRLASVAADHGTLSNSEGRTYAACELNSLAYLAYERAAGQGVSVARINIANLLLKGSVGAAAIRLIEEHKGKWDAADPAYPFETLARLETVLHQEREKRDAANEAGRVTFQNLIAWARSVWQPNQPISRPAEKITVPSTGKTFERKGDSPNLAMYDLSVEGKSIEFALFQPFILLRNFWVAEKEPGKFLLVWVDERGSMSGVSCDLGSVTPTLEPVEYRAHTEGQPAPNVLSSARVK
jgi:hypothetical protein